MDIRIQLPEPPPFMCAANSFVIYIYFTSLHVENQLLVLGIAYGNYGLFIDFTNYPNSS